MKSLDREDLVPLRKCLDELLDFIHELQMEELPYYYNLEICFLVQYEGWEQMEQILVRDWSAANHAMLGIPGFDFAAESAAEKAELDCRFIELLANIETFLA